MMNLLEKKSNKEKANLGKWIRRFANIALGVCSYLFFGWKGLILVTLLFICLVAMIAEIGYGAIEAMKEDS